MLAFLVWATGSMVAQPVPVADKKPEKPAFLSSREVEAEAKGALVPVLAYLADSDKELKALLMSRERLTSKVKDLAGTGEAPKTLAKAKADLAEARTAVLARQAKLVQGFVPPDRFDTRREAVRRPPDARFGLRPKSKEEGARTAGELCSGLLQFIDAKHRAALERVHLIEADKTRLTKALALADDPDDKEGLRRKLKSVQAELDKGAQVAGDSRLELLRRLIDDLNEGRGVAPVKLYSLSGED